MQQNSAADAEEIVSFKPNEQFSGSGAQRPSGQLMGDQTEENQSFEFNFAGSDPTSGVNTEPHETNENYEQFFIN